MAARYLISAAAVGAIAMFMLDPRHGRGRRERARDQATRAWGQLDAAFGATSKDMKSRTRGLMSELKARIAGEEVPDALLVERVRSRLGWAVSHPGAIDVQSSHGRIVLSGAVLEREYIRLLRTVWAVRGVVDVEDRLAVYESSAGIPALQGEGRQLGRRTVWLQESWSPTARALIGGLGLGLIAQSLIRRRASDLPFAVAGTAFFLRSVTNQPIDRLVGAATPAVEVEKSLDVEAPLEQVFEAFAHFENFPQYMPNVREILVRGDGTSRWSVAGPAGQTISWDALTTRLEPNRLISWRSLPGSAVEHAGFVRFEPKADGGTRVLLAVSYTPRGGPLGAAVAKLLGPDTGSALDADLGRMKVFLESGRRGGEAAGAARH
jgi:uncharacterized membrane protein